MIPHFIRVWADSHEIYLNVDHIVSITIVGSKDKGGVGMYNSSVVEIEDINKHRYRLDTCSRFDPLLAAYEIIKNQY